MIHQPTLKAFCKWLHTRRSWRSFITEARNNPSLNAFDVFCALDCFYFSGRFANLDKRYTTLTEGFYREVVYPEEATMHPKFHHLQYDDRNEIAKQLFAQLKARK